MYRKVLQAIPGTGLGVVFASSIVLGAMASANSESPDKDESDLADLGLEQLLEIEVKTVSRRKERLTHTTAAAYVITSEDISRSAARSIPELLREVPGLHVARIDANKWAVSSRGFNSRFANKLLVLIDGRSIYSPSFSGVYWESVDLMLEEIDRIEVIRGPGAALWGSNAVNGIINIITKGASEAQGGFARLALGTEEHGLAAARYGVKLAEETYLKAYGRYSRRDGAAAADGTDLQDNSRSVRGGVRFDWDGTADSFTVSADLFDLEGHHHTGGPLFDPPFFRTGREPYSHSGHSFLYRWIRTVSPNSDLELQFYYDKTHLDQYGLREDRDTLDIDFQHRFWLGKSQNLIWGLGYRRSWDRFRNTFIYSLLPESVPTDMFSAFVQEDVTLMADRLRLTVGAKFEGVRFHYPSGSESLPRGTQSHNSIQPNVRLLWTPSESQTFWAAAARAVRNPSRGEQSAQIKLAVLPPGVLHPDLPIGVTLLGTPKFGPEILRAFEGGYRARISERFSLDLAAFYNSYSGLRSGVAKEMSFLPLPVPHLKLPVEILNRLNGNTYGLEAALRWHHSERWSSRLSYSYFQPDFEDQGGVLNDFDPLLGQGISVLGEAPRHQVFLRTSLNITPTLRLNADFRWIDDLASVGDYAEADALLSWQRGESVTFSLGARNLLHGQHQESVQELFEFPSQIQRGMYAEVTWAF